MELGKVKQEAFEKLKNLFCTNNVLPQYDLS